MATSDDDVLCAALDQQCSILASVLNNIETKCSVIQGRMVASEESSVDAQIRLAQRDEEVARLKADGRERELMLYQEVVRLETALHAERLQGDMAGARAKALVMEAERLRAARDNMAVQRDHAVAELAAVMADMEAMQATLADTAIYVRYLRRKVLELEIEGTRNAARSLLRTEEASAVHGPPGLSLASIKDSIRAAVKDACSCGEEEQRKRLRQLQLRWHPDKNPVLTEVATEVTKLINEAITEFTQE